MAQIKNKRMAKKSWYQKYATKKLTEEEEFHLECSRNEISFKHDLSSIDGGMKERLGNVNAMYSSTDYSS